MADTNDDYEIGALLGAPIRAIQQAQIEAEREYVRFMLEYGMEQTSNANDHTLKLRELEFGMTRSFPDPVQPGQVVDHHTTVRAPLLSIVQMPAIGIEEATIDLNLDVELDVEETKSAMAQPASPSATAPLLRNRVKSPVLKGAIGNGGISKDFRTQGKLDISIKLRSTHNDDLHGRLARLISEGLSTGTEVPETK